MSGSVSERCLQHLRVNQSLVLHRIQVAPPAMPAVVTRTRRTALRTAGLPMMLDADLHRAACHQTPPTRMRLVHAKHHLPHSPRRLDPQQRLERLGTLHPASLWLISSLSRPPLPTQLPEDPINQAPLQPSGQQDQHDQVPANLRELNRKALVVGDEDPECGRRGPPGGVTRGSKRGRSRSGPQRARPTPPSPVACWC